MGNFRRIPGKVRVLEGILDLEERGVTDDEMFELSGISLAAMKYNAHMDHISSRTDPFVLLKKNVCLNNFRTSNNKKYCFLCKTQTSTDNGDKLIIDLGMSGGMDALYYSQHGYTVLGVEANGNAVRKVLTQTKLSFLQSFYHTF